MYDRKCEELARAFLEDEVATDVEMEQIAPKLAQHIQDAIEAFIAFDVKRGVRDDGGRVMANYYVSFGQVHVHSVNGKTFDKDCLALVEAETPLQGRAKAVSAFGNKWSFFYDEDELPEIIRYFPRGVIRMEQRVSAHEER